MRKFIAILLALSLFGCLGPAKFAIPDKPEFKNVMVYPVAGGIMMSNKDANALRDSIMALEDYADKMRKMLEDQQK